MPAENAVFWKKRLHLYSFLAIYISFGLYFYKSLSLPLNHRFVLDFGHFSRVGKHAKQFLSQEFGLVLSIFKIWCDLTLHSDSVNFGLSSFVTLHSSRTESSLISRSSKAMATASLASITVVPLDSGFNRQVIDPGGILNYLAIKAILGFGSHFAVFDFFKLLILLSCFSAPDLRVRIDLCCCTKWWIITTYSYLTIGGPAASYPERIYNLQGCPKVDLTQ